ncbi:MAG: metallophosphoesterase [Desulfatirhabdiaceae bacterium]
MKTCQHVMRICIFLAVGCLTAFSHVLAAQEVRFAVISDAHYFDNALGVTGEAFEAYLAVDRKMIAESEAILVATIDAIRAANVQFLLISGDLTKDGELSSHQEMANYLQILEDSGTHVYVIPGNHDVNNPNAVAYDGPDTIPVPNISPEEFEGIYNNFGFDQALSRDPHSLGYLAEPSPGLCILAMDSCRYRENQDYPIVGGHFSAETLDWIFNQIVWAQANGKQIIGMMHHGIIQHFSMQALLFQDWVVDDWLQISRFFADAGLPLVFTGHFHAQDVVKRSWGVGEAETFLFDAETGSLVTYPVPHRIVTLDMRRRHAKIESHTITEINYDTNGMPFPEYAMAYLEEDMLLLSQDILVNVFGLDSETAETLAPHVMEAMIAHYAGDEDPTPANRLVIQNCLHNPDPAIRLIGAGLHSVWTDPAPADNHVILDLATGAYWKGDGLP